MRVFLLVLTAVGTLVGCGSSPPTRFYTLDAVQPQAIPPVSATVTAVKVNAVHVPPLLDRRSMVRHERDNQLDIASQDRWGASFGEMTQGVLTEDLQSRLPAGSVIPAQAPAPPNAHGLVVNILSFVPDASGQLTLNCDWSLLAGSPAHPILSRAAHLQQPAGTTAASQAHAMSELLGKLADQIATAISRGPPSETAQK